jgi:hypothetical protein
MIGWLLLALAASQQTPSADPCAAPAACRRVDTVRIQSPDGKETELPINQNLPWVVQDNLLLVPGDWIVIRLVERDGKLLPQLVRAGNTGDAPAPADGEIRVRVMPFNKGNLIMEVLSRRPETLDYAAIVVLGANKPQRTSVCSLQPGIPVFESWQWPIRQIALFGFRPTSEPGCKTIDLKGDPTKSPPST